MTGILKAILNYEIKFWVMVTGMFIAEMLWTIYERVFS